MPQRGKRKPVRSGFEKRNIADLDSRKVKYEYEPKDKRVAYAVEKKYLPDLVLRNRIIIELKGWFKPADRTKHLLIKAQHPDLDIRFVFQKASNKLNKTSKTTYANWCNKHGFLWAEGFVPQSWIDEKPTRKRSKQ